MASLFRDSLAHDHAAQERFQLDTLADRRAVESPGARARLRAMARRVRGL